MRIIKVSFDCGGLRMAPKGKGHSGKLDDQLFDECKGYETDRDISKKNRDRKKSHKKASVKLAQLENGAEVPYIDYLNAVDDLLEQRRGSTSTQDEMETVDECQNAGMTPDECAREIMGI